METLIFLIFVGVIFYVIKSNSKFGGGGGSKQRYEKAIAGANFQPTHFYPTPKAPRLALDAKNNLIYVHSLDNVAELLDISKIRGTTLNREANQVNNRTVQTAVLTIEVQDIDNPIRKVLFNNHHTAEQWYERLGIAFNLR